MSVRPPDKLKQILKEKAHVKGYTLNQLILQILWDWIEQDKKGANK